MSYTTKQRNKIYKKALKLYKPYDCANYLGLCFAIKIITGNDSHYFDDQRLALFPEFDLFFGAGEIWLGLGYNIEGFITRQTILSFCIAMTEN